jgi:Pectate lyase superfamily protein
MKPGCTSRDRAPRSKLVTSGIATAGLAHPVVTGLVFGCFAGGCSERKLPPDAGTVATTTSTFGSSVKDFGAQGDGSTDDTAAIQAAIDACGSNSCTVVFPPGNYVIRDTIVVSHDLVNLLGSGRSSTLLIFAPTMPGAAIKFSKPAMCQGGAAPCGDIVRGSLKGFSFYTHDATVAKIGIELVAASEMVIEDVTIGGDSGGGAWSGGGNSIGLRTRGHDVSSFSRLTISADTPISIETNPLVYANGTFPIDIDHFHFSDLYLIANKHPCIDIGDNVVLTQVTFDGREAWVRGTYGLRWVNTIARLASNGLYISNLRTEQGTDPNAYSISIESSASQIQNVMITGLYADPGRNGIHLRGTYWTAIQNLVYGGSGIALDATASNVRLNVHNSFFQLGSSVGSGTTITPLSDGWVNSP